ncbi:MAG: NUDIX hydrolase [Microgenomates group bacterium GW2011_GWA1_Microgenomates_45_10]|nr:MAG: NUDIX hydrolase [Microgenomates group bacterium GW2011_GWB1_44_8]KKT87389.1 MAG: NUDIX hydrolase [Microgenomates group bacterium GW2011_GWA1_Microgenomates_45_10]
MIHKDINRYALTAPGKMAAARLDTASGTVEKQPKISVYLIPHLKTGGIERYLVQERKKEPYFGYWGFITGKIRFGETLGETAERELAEETGLTGAFRFCYEIHEMVYDKKSGNQLEDKFFHVMEAFDLSGKVKTRTIEGRNKYVTAEEFWPLTPKYHNEDDLFRWFLEKDFKLKEEKYYIDKF